MVLTKEYGILKVEVSCNNSSSIGQISFGNDGRIYSKLGLNQTEILNPCEIKLFDKDDDFITIVVEPWTGFIDKL